MERLQYDGDFIVVVDLVCCQQTTRRRYVLYTCSVRFR
jgi:hypothetical protein